MDSETITQEYVKQCFHYDPKTGSLTWLERPRDHFKSEKSWRHAVDRYAGSEAGCVNNRGYVRVRINKQPFMAHRLAWMYVYGEWPKHHIDHINGVKTDNRIKNLRDVSCQENSWNQRKPCSNKSGVVGVFWHKQHGKWCSKIKVNGKEIHLGLFSDKFEAICARKSSESKYGFHTNHGRAA